MMKLVSGALTLYHVDAGRHRESLRWHDNDHKAEVIATLPSVYLSQRWVSPPDWVALRPPTQLPFCGGEYANIYWSTGTVDDLEHDFAAMGQRLADEGRMAGISHMHRLWPAMPKRRLRPTAVLRAPGVIVSPEAVAASTGNSGLIVVIGEVAPEHWDDLTSWHETDYLPALLRDTGLAGVARFVSDAPDLAGCYVLLGYTDVDSPQDLYSDCLSWAAARSFTGERITFSGVYRPSIGRYDDYE